jgi:lambda repressor-like predicted transcriptional regulator
MNTLSATPFAAEFQVQAFKLASPIILALQECDPELRDAALELFEQLHGEELDPEQSLATAALLAEILFPNADESGFPGLDLQEAERIASTVNPEAGPVLARMDEQEATFAYRLRGLMDERGLTQTELAAKVGIGQPAISMMLNRACRPQRKTVRRIAAALEVEPDALWPMERGE